MKQTPYLFKEVNSELYSVTSSNSKSRKSGGCIILSIRYGCDHVCFLKQIVSLAQSLTTSWLHILCHVTLQRWLTVDRSCFEQQDDSRQDVSRSLSSLNMRTCSRLVYTKMKDTWSRASCPSRAS